MEFPRGARFTPPKRPARYEPHLRTRFLSCRCRPPSHARLRPGARGSFFKILDRARGLRVMARPCGELTIAHGAQLPAERLLGDRDAELLEDPLCQIDQPPTHHAVDCRNRATLNHAGDGRRWTSLSFDG